MTEELLIDDGGPVHPRVANLPECAGSQGLCVRDYFALGAMQTIIESGHTTYATDFIVDIAYMIADKMIARSKQAPTPKMVVLDELKNVPDAMKEMMRDSHDPKTRKKYITAPRVGTTNFENKTKHNLVLTFFSGGTITFTLYSETKELNRRLTFQGLNFVWDFTSKGICFFREIEILDLQKELNQQESTIEMCVDEKENEQ